MPSRKLTNAIPDNPQYLVQTRVRVKPYVASAYTSQLTPKERMARQQSRLASGIGGGSGMSFGGNTMLSAQGNFFSPQLSTDFLELPQSLREKREWYRHFYNNDELVGQAIDLHTELPLSKVRLAPPKPRVCPDGFKDPHDYGKYILSRFQKMCDRLKLFQRLITIVHHYWLDGNCLPADELVTVDGGMKLAEDVEVGDLVLTHTGKWSPVSAVVQLEAKELVGLDIARLPGKLRLTPEHPVEMLDQGGPRFVPAKLIQPNDYVRVSWPSGIRDLEVADLLDEIPDFVSPFETGYVVSRVQTKLRTKNAQCARDFLLAWLTGLKAPVFRSRKSIAKAAGVPVHTLDNVILTLQQDIAEPFRVRIPNGKKKGPHTLWLPLSGVSTDSESYEVRRNWFFPKAKTHLPVNDDLLYVLGYWLGDGCLGRDQSRDTSWGRGLWTVCGGTPSLDYLSRVEASLVRLLGEDSVVRSISLIDNEPLYVLRVRGNPAFVEWWASNFGETSHGPNPKRVPAWVLDLPHEKQLHLLAGLIDSDGCVPRTHAGGVQIGVTSLNIVAAARDMMLRLGAVPSLNISGIQTEVVEIKGRLCRRNFPSFTLSVHTEEAARYLVSKSCKARRLEEAPRFFESANNYKIRDDGVYFKVCSVETLPGEPVFNFQVPGDETFRARFVSTHNCAIFAEDGTVDVPFDIGHTKQVNKKSVIQGDGSAIEQEEDIWVERHDREQRELVHYSKKYQGWAHLIILPIDQVKITSFSFTDKVRMELIPSDRDRRLVEQAKMGDPVAEEMVQAIPAEVREHVEQGQLIPMGTDPDEGSFVYLLTGRKGADEELGHSILDRCLRTLVYRDKLRQAQTSIASRAMTPKRVIWAEGLSDADVEDLREQVDLALVDPDYSIVANYEIRWEEMGARDRLLDLSTEYEQTERRLLAGLGVTESLMSGESLYSGDRLKLEVINQRYLHLREIIQDYVERQLFIPVARRMGFVEKDEWGQEVVLYPRLSFTRLPLRDSQDTFDALFNLYTKGSISIDLILEMLNIDPDDTRTKIEADMLTVNDAVFNEVMRSVYSEVGRLLADKTDIVEQVAKYLKLKMKPAEAEEGGGGRF